MKIFSFKWSTCRTSCSEKVPLKPLFLSLLISGIASANPPNIVMLLADDQGWTGTSVQMDPSVAESKSDFYQTPNLESLAAAGMRFSNAYAAAPVCSPTRASIVTGKSPAQLQMTDTIQGGITGSARFNERYIGHPLSPPLTLQSLPRDEITLAEWIKQSEPRYVTAHIGKWHLSTQRNHKPVDQGYDFEADLSGFTWNPHEDPKAIFGLTTIANNFMEQRSNAGEPFMMQLSHHAVHAPLSARKQTIDKYNQMPSGQVHDNVIYAAMTEDLDTSIGLLLQKIRDLGIEDNTYVIYTSDNGGGSTRTANDPLFTGKGRVWEGGIRVPFIISGPGIQAGSVSDVPVTSMDLFNTIGELAGVSSPVPDGVEGTSLVPLLGNAGQLPVGTKTLKRANGENGELYFHYPHNFPPFVSGVDSPGSAIRDGDFKLVRVYGEKDQPDELFLFNLSHNLTESDDPNSPANLADAMPAKTAELVAKLDNWLDAVDASLPYDVAENVELVWDGQETGSDANGWRSTVDVNYRARETWAMETDHTRPEHVVTGAHQPGLSKQAFSFDSGDRMTRKFFHVSDPKDPDLYDNDHSSSFEFWLRLDSLDQKHVLFEAGDGTSGLSVTMGDGDSDGDFDEVRFRVLGDDGKHITVTSELDLFADPTRDFVQLAAVFNDSETDRYAELFVNGALFGRVDGVSGAEEHINWDGFDEAGLGNQGGTGLGGNGGGGDLLPFHGAGMRGDLAYFHFYNYAIDDDTVLAHYNSKLASVDAGIGSTSLDVQVPADRPGDLGEGLHEGDASPVILVIQERKDVLAEELPVDIRPVEGQLYGRMGLSQDIGGTLPAEAIVSSYLIHFDPGGDPATNQNASGSVTFDQAIAGILIEPSSLEQTDLLLGTIGRYPTGIREFDLLGIDELLFTDNLHTLTVSLNAMLDEVVQLRVLTILQGDFNGDGDVDGDDFLIWENNFPTITGALRFDGDANGDGAVDGNDFVLWQRNFMLPAALGQTPEPASLSLLVLGTLLLLSPRRY